MFKNGNPTTNYLHDRWKEAISTSFSEIELPEESSYLSLINYIDRTPQKFYNRDVFLKYYQVLLHLKSEHPLLLSEVLIEFNGQISIANKVLNEINENCIHDILIPSDHNELIDFIDRNIHYNLLKLYETPLYYFTKIIAKYRWKLEGKGTDGLNLYNCINEMIDAGFECVKTAYIHEVRNGIAHGKSVFSDLNISYIDQRGNTFNLGFRRLIEVFDEAIDFTNAICLAYKIFCISNSDYLNSFKVKIPNSILIDELKVKVDGPGWEIRNCLDSIAINDRKQLIIYVNNSNWDYSKVRIYCFITAYWAEALTKTYDRLFIVIKSKRSGSGWAAFNAKLLKRLREENVLDMEQYGMALEENLLFFIPKFQFPKIFYTLGTYRSILKVITPIAVKEFSEKISPKAFYVRYAKIHRKRTFSVVSDPRIILNCNTNADTQDILRKNVRRIVKAAIKEARKTCGRFSLTRYLPVKYIRVMVYNSDIRVRQLHGSGLIPQLIASIEVNTSNQIKTIDIFGGTIEQYGKYRIVWNKPWIETFGRSEHP